ncbi:MAG: GTP cyclohydrolase II [Phylliscum demangeonii]|nr:MAG: GTP cyclohydrolase II [Phylliscum demangeonii]
MPQLHDDAGGTVSSTTTIRSTTQLPDLLLPRPKSETGLHETEPDSPHQHHGRLHQHSGFPFQTPTIELSTFSTSRASTPTTDPVPPSLLSPAFTPPSTPGTTTPVRLLGAHAHAHTHAHAHREPRCVPVDSANGVHGGVGTRKPRLLESLPEVNCVVAARIPMTNGTEMFLHLYQNSIDHKEHLAIVFGRQIRSRTLNTPRPGETEMDRMIRGAYVGRLFPGRTSSQMDEHPSEDDEADEQDASARTLPPPLVRIHSECYTGETAWSARCDCGEQLDEAARLMSQPSTAPSGGVIVYLRQEGRGIGLLEKLKAYNLQDLGNDTVEANLLLRHPADARSYGLATAILLDLGLGGARGIRLLTNNPDKIRAVEGPGREVVVTERVAMVPLAWRTPGQMGVWGKEVEGYLKTKIEKMGHLLRLE